MDPLDQPPGEPTDDQPPAGDPPAGDPPAGDPPAGDLPADPPANPGKSGGEDDPAIAKVRREAANYRTKYGAETEARKAAEKAASDAAQERDNLRKVLEGLNKVLNPGSEEVTPEKLAEQLEAERAERAREKDDAAAQIRQLKVESALPAVFTRLNADPDLTLAVLVRDGVLSKLDPDKKSFAADLESAIEDALSKNPKLKTTPAVVRSGTEPTGKAGSTDQLTYEQVQKMTPEQIEEARRKGRLKKLLGGG